MCRLVGVLASTCRHPVTYRYDRCNLASYPYRCNDKPGAIDAYSIKYAPDLCEACWKETEAKMYAEYHEERREMTKRMRSEHLEDEEISVVRMELRDLFYERLKNVNKPLPPVPDRASINSHSTVEKSMEVLQANSPYRLGGNPPIEVRREEKLVISVGQERLPRGPI